MDDPYKVLGLDRDATRDDIRRAYRKLVKKHHPDLNPGNARSEEIFKAVSAANALLTDLEKKGQYDRGEIDAQGQPQRPRSSYRTEAEADTGGHYGPGAGWGDAQFDDLFGSMFRRPRDDGPRRGEDERFSLITSFLDAVNGGAQRITLPDGRTLDVKLPPGTLSGQVLRLRGRGAPGHNGEAPGDALIEIEVARHPFFTRDGQDIHMVLPISLKEAVLGGPVETPTPSGAVKLRIPAHADSGTELRLRGRGVAAHGGVVAGDLYVTLKVTIGAADAALDDFIRQWTPDLASNPRAAMEPGS